MFTDKQLDQLAKLIDTCLDAKIGPIIDEKLKPIKESQERIEKKLEVEVTDLAENMGDIMTKLDKLDDLETRISQLEEDNEFPRLFLIMNAGATYPKNDHQN